MSKKKEFRIDVPTQMTIICGGIRYVMYLQSGQEPEQRERPCLVYKLSRPQRDALERVGGDHNMRVIVPVKELPF